MKKVLIYFLFSVISSVKHEYMILDNGLETAKKEFPGFDRIIGKLPIPIINVTKTAYEKLAVSDCGSYKFLSQGKTR